MKAFKQHFAGPLAILFVVALAALSVAWIPVNTSVPPHLRDLITEQRGIVDHSTHGELFDDFIYLNTTLWDTTAVVSTDGGASAAVLDSLSALGVLKISLPAFKGEGMNIQTESKPVKIIRASKPDSSGVETEYECRFKATDISQYTLLAGICSNDTNLYGGQSNGIYFIKHDGSTTLYGKEIKTNESLADTVSLGTVANNTWYRLKLVWNGASVAFYVNDIYKGRTSTSTKQPVGLNLMPSFECANGDSTVDYTYLDYVRVRQRR